MNDAAILPERVWAENTDMVQYTVPIYDHFLVIVCSYNYTERMVRSDLMDAYLQFPYSYYSSLLLTLIGFIVAWKTCARLAGKLSSQVRDELENARTPAWWIMVRAILDQDQYPNVSKVAFSILSFCVSLLFFVAVDCFMLNTMSADLVVIEEPAVIRSYEDIVNRNGLRVLFFKGMDEESFFNAAKEGTLEYEVWKRRWVHDNGKMDTVSKVSQPIFDQTAIAIAREWMVKTSVISGLTTLRELEWDKSRVLLTKDPTGKFLSFAFMIQKEAPQQLKDYMNQR